MIENEVSVKGIILSVTMQGEYGKRISLLSDKYGKITAFANGAAKQTSKIIGAVRPFVCGEFSLSRGKTAWNVHGVSVIESFEEIPLNPEAVFLGTYFLELVSYFAEEGITEEDARKSLNLVFVALTYLKKENFHPELARRIFELRLLKQEGLYTELPSEQEAGCEILWNYCISSGLKALYDEAVWKRALTEDGKLNPAGEAFVYSVKHLKNSQIEKHFKSEELL